jgi:uncharacterized protein (TIGR02452 family)
MNEHNKYYWEGKKQRAESAKRHTQEMERKYSTEIRRCVDNTVTFSGPINLARTNEEEFLYKNVTMEVVRSDTVSALMSNANSDGRIALLNFASYKHPGGGFMVGSRAQEESLCHESFLYNVLKEFDGTYYNQNCNDLNRGLYRDRALYSPGVLFVKNGKAKNCDVVTCAAPNFSVAEKFVSRGINNTVLGERVRFILEIAKVQKVDTFIVGSWGCGVFQQDPRALAKCFEEECQKVFIDSKIHLVFAVIPPLPNQTDNLTPFVKLVDKWNSNN